jgi:hypothetical protein
MAACRRCLSAYGRRISPSAEDGCLDAAARSLGISDLSDTAHISHLLDFVSYLRQTRVKQNALTRECLRGTWVTQGSNEDLCQLAERSDVEYRAQLYATAYYAMHQDVLAVQFLLHMSNHAEGERDIDSVRQADIVDACSELNRTLPLLQQPALESVPEEWHKPLSDLWGNPSLLAWAHDHTGEVERQGDRMEGNFQTRITNMIVRCSQ